MQSAVLRFVTDFCDAHRFGPTSREIQEHFGHASQTTALVNLRALERKGYISRINRSARAITVLKRP